MNEPRIRIRFRPHLESFCDWSRAFRKAIPDLKCVGEPGKFGIEISGKPVGRNAEAAFQPIALGGADLANPAILQHSQDRKENQEKANQNEAGLRACHHEGIIRTRFGRPRKNLLTGMERK